MNKSQLVNAIADKAELSKAQAEKALNAFIESVTDSLAGGGSITLVGFGTFSVKDRAARNGRNPQTGETIEIKASRVPSFKAGSNLKDACN